MIGRRLNVYEHKKSFKAAIITLGFLIGGATLVYTNYLVNALSDREKKQVDLYAMATKKIIDTSYNGDPSFPLEIIQSNETIPVILVDKNGVVIQANNITLPEKVSPKLAMEKYKKELAIMKKQYEPIEVNGEPYFTNFIYYRNSPLVTQLRFYPYIQLAAFSLLVVIGYLAFSASRRSEQNRIWAGLAKETAHQLGTPISSLMAWLVYLKSQKEFADSPYLIEMEKDVERLNMIADRFSQIGSVAKMELVEIEPFLTKIADYLKRRISKKIVLSLDILPGTPKRVSLNGALMEWVFENIIKNAADAISGDGKITLSVRGGQNNNEIIIDIHDTGKGMTSSQASQVFNPGFTTKKRGWGLGLTLSKRIVEEYHNGKLSILKTELNKGTSFRIYLKSI